MSRLRYGEVLAAILFAGVMATGCGTVEHKVVIDEQYAVLPETRVALGPVENQTGQAFDIEIESMLADALAQSLREKNLEWQANPTPKLVLTTNIVQYEKGDAFKRWLMPGWGSTVLVVRGDLADAEGHVVGSVDAKRTVDAGGGYTIGAWKTVFRDMANDIVEQLEEKLR
jgi:hypothetical protein